MSLRVWLPLISDNHNQGLMDLTATNIGTVSFIDGGKFGKCLSAGNGTQITNGISYNSNLVSELGDEYSCAIWVKPLGNHVHSNGTFVSSGNWNAKRWTFGVSQDNSQVDVFCSGHNTYITCAVPVNEWTHLACSCKSGVVKLYKNGEYIGERAIGAELSSDAVNFTVGRETYANGYFSFNGNLNDLRIYDHALSAKEIKELSKGLVAHYTLDNMINTSNLIINGYGELGGNIGWTNTNVSTTEIPSGHSEIKASFYTSNMTKDHILLYPNHSYTLEVYIKSSGATSGNTYPSIYPYDADKKFINNYNSLSGFDVSTKTTLKQPLKKGDTVIYANDLSKWNTASNYFYFVAIFGYKNSYGEVYDDLVYTADAPTFGTYSDKSNIDKTNNTITLDAPFTGEDRPIGTAICQSTAGGTFYYPFGGIALSTLSDWVYKTATFTPKDTPRLMAAKYIEYSTYYSTYHAGIRLIDNDVNSSIVYDSSGYCNNGVAHGNLTIAPSAPRYSLSTVFNGTNTYIEADSLPSETISISCWLKTPWTSSSEYRIAIHDKATGLAIGWSDTRMITYVGSSNGGTGSILQTSGIWTANQWHHVVIVKTGNTTRDIYIDGVKMNPSGANYWGGDLNKLNIGNRHINGSYSAYWDGQISDFRAYTTSLSEEDIKELYQSAGSVDNHGNSFVYEYKEE